MRELYSTNPVFCISFDEPPSPMHAGRGTWMEWFFSPKIAHLKKKVLDKTTSDSPFPFQYYVLPLSHGRNEKANCQQNNKQLAMRQAWYNPFFPLLQRQPYLCLALPCLLLPIHLPISKLHHIYSPSLLYVSALWLTQDIILIVEPLMLLSWNKLTLTLCSDSRRDQDQEPKSFT